MSKCSIYMFIVVTIHLLFAHGEKKEDALCLIVTELCIQDVLTDISKAATDIHVMAIEIERSMKKEDPNGDTLQNSIDMTCREIMSRSPFPTSINHDKYSNLPNIDKHNLTHLFIEQHNAVSYLYYSIKNLLALNHIHDNEYDELFNKSQDVLQHAMLCGYRNILHAYAENWQPVHPIKSIRFPKSRKFNTTSLEYRSYAIVILQLSRRWMTKIEHIINDLENKLI